MKTDSNPMTVRSDWDNLYESDGEVPDITLKQPYEIAFWGQLLPSLLKKVSSPGKLIELGSAPGRYAMILSQITGHEPFGVEYTAAGVKLNRKTFAKYGVSPDNVYNDSFLNMEFIGRHKNSFDLVGSFGLIEHFENPATALDAHIDLLKPGGMLVVSIPNYRGWNGIWMRLVDPGLAKGHNFEIMKLPVFKALFNRSELDIQYIGMAARYHYFFAGKQTGFKRFIQLIHINLEPIIHWILAKFSKKLNVETEFFSPYILCVARKVSSSS